jgi:hypothetical protein
MRNLLHSSWLGRAALAAALLLAPPAWATSLANVTITTAGAAQIAVVPGGTATSIQSWPFAPDAMTIQCNFTYGSGGTSADAWIQTSFDGGTTWVDVAECGFLLASAIKMYNLSGLTPVTTAYTPTDGSLGANTSKDGLLGTLFRVKYTTVGTYAGGTTLKIDVVPNQTRLQVK